MPEKKRIRGKLVASFIVLAAAGGGAYYVTSGGALDWLGGAEGVVARLELDRSSEPRAADYGATDLNAVASAWADAARSAPQEVDTVRTDDAEDSVRPDDRYAIKFDSPTPTIAVEPTPEPLVDDQFVQASAEVEDSVARGQEPYDDDELEVIADDDEPIVEESATGTNPLRGSSREPADEEPARRARDAFREQALPADDRYGAAPSRDVHNDDVGSAVNPFASQSSPLPAAGREPEPVGRQPATEIEPLPFDEPSTQGSFRASAGDRSNYGDPRTGLRSSPPSSLPNSFGDSPRGFGSESDSATEGTGRPGERALEGPQNPTLVIQKLAPPEIQVGKPAKFIIQLQNVGSQAADNVVIRDEVPRGTRFVNASPKAEASGSQLVWQLGKLSSGEERTVEIQLMPTAEGEVGSVATVSYSAQASAKTRSTMPQLAIRMTAPSEVMVGSEQRVKIELHNPGSGDATGVMLFDNVPDNLRHEAGPTLEFEVGTLRAGETRELELIMYAERAGHVVNVLTARADGNLQVDQQVEFDVIAPALIVGVDGPERRYLERPATYQVTVENPGTATAHDVHLITKLPQAMQFVRANNMGEYDAATHAIYWNLAELPEGERGIVELTAMPIESGTHTLEIEGRAQQGLSDQTRHQISIEGLAAIMFEVRDLEDPIEVGGETTYEIRVVNQGTKAATDVQVAVQLPPGLQLVSATGEPRHAVQGGNVVFEPISQLAPKADAVYRIQAQGVRPGDQRVSVEVHTSDHSQPIRKEESTRVFGDE